MLLRLTQNAQIEDLRNHPAAMIEKLRRLLVSGTEARPDPRRSGFYEVENHSQIFYIHISPVTGKVWLLAIWPKDQTPTVRKVVNPAPRVA